MYRKLISLVSLILLLVLSSTALATTYYVSPSGNDNNSGTSPAEAWQTIAHVNDVTFADGDTILFEGGQTFTGGGLTFDTSDGGTAISPLTIGSYGSGRATISSGLESGGYGFYTKDRAAFVIENLNFVGPGRAANETDKGIVLWSDLDGGVKFDYLRINDVNVSAYGYRGIEIGSWTSSPSANARGFKDVQITNTEIYDCGSAALFTYGNDTPESRANEDWYIGDCKIHDNPGVPGMSPHSGNGIMLSGIDGVTVEFCEAWNNGQLNDAGGGGPVGIWCYEANNVVMQFNESHHNKTSGGDGGGFDIDGGTLNCVMQYNYAHDNEGPGYQFAQFSGATAMKDNVCRYNISENDGWASRVDQGGISFWSNSSGGGMQDSLTYGNTFYVGPDTRGAAIQVHNGNIHRAKIHNNIFYTVPGKRVVFLGLQGTKGADLTFQGNCYWSSGDTLEIKWRSPTYWSLAEWRAATGQEMLDGQPVGYEVDPLLVNPGGSLDTDYKLQSSSPMKDAGLDLPTLFGIDPGPQDYWGTSIPQDGAYDVGSHELVGGPPDTDPPSPDPMTWSTVPYATGAFSIAMVATTATDASGVEYYFTCVSGGGNSSGWQDNTSYTDTGLSPETQYCYQVQARDKSANQNATGWSTTECATTEAAPPSVYVYDISMSSYESKAGYYIARAAVWIKDTDLLDISGATVTGDWSGATSGNEEGITGGDGKVTLESKAVKGGGTFTFCVTDVSATGYTYEPSLNNETCDSVTAP